MAKSRPATAGRDAAKLPRLPGDSIDCVNHHGTDTRLEQVKLEKTELEKKAF